VLTALLTLRWDLFTGFSSDAEVQRARAESVSAELDLRQAQLEIDASVAASAAQLQAGLEEVEVAAGNLAVARRGLSLAEERYKAGAASTLEARDAQLKVAQAELVVLGSRIDIEIRWAALQRAMGTSPAPEAKR
jgi:outer membrane protein